MSRGGPGRQTGCRFACPSRSEQRTCHGDPADSRRGGPVSTPPWSGFRAMLVVDMDQGGLKAGPGWFRFRTASGLKSRISTRISLYRRPQTVSVPRILSACPARVSPRMAGPEPVHAGREVTAGKRRERAQVDSPGHIDAAGLAGSRESRTRMLARAAADAQRIAGLVARLRCDKVCMIKWRRSWARLSG